MSEQVRIPDINPESFGSQLSRAVDESYIRGYFDEASDVTTGWVKYQRSLDSATSQTTANLAGRLLTSERLLAEANEAFRIPGVTESFNNLLTAQARNNGELDDFVERFGLGEHLTLEQRVDRALTGNTTRSSDGEEIYDFAKVFQKKSTPQKARLELVRLHTDALNVAEAKLQEALPELRGQFEHDLQTAVDDGILPASALRAHSRAKQIRLTNLKVFVSDPLVNKANDRGGHYNAQENAIYIDATAILRSTNRLKRTFYHEMLHAHSGLTVRLDDTEPTTDEWGISDELEQLDVLETESISPSNMFVRIGRVGLRRKSMLLNEAYTEWAAMQLTGNEYYHGDLWFDAQTKEDPESLRKQYGSVYLAERIMLAGMSVAGIDDLSIGEAYFESYEPKLNNPDRNIGETIPANRTLDNLVSEKTRFKSMEQLLRHVEVEGKKQLDSSGAGDKHLLRYYQIPVLDEALGFPSDQ
ncbi:MAG: hypothetical protein V4702_06210 [Patescibacteria group bacterium]